MTQNTVWLFVVVCGALLISGCSGSQQNGSLDEPPCGLPLPDTVTGNADYFEKGFEISSNSSVEAYIVDDSVNNTLDYYRNNLEEWGEPNYTRDQLRSFNFHRLEFRDEGEITIGVTNLKGKTYMAIIGSGQ